MLGSIREIRTASHLSGSNMAIAYRLAGVPIQYPQPRNLPILQRMASEWVVLVEDGLRVTATVSAVESTHARKAVSALPFADQPASKQVWKCSPRSPTPKLTGD